MSGAVPPPAARPLERAARVPRPVCPGCGRCGRVDPAPAPQRAPLRAGVARCGGGGRASPGGVPSTVVRGAWCQALSLPRPPVLWSGQPGFRDPCVPGAVDAGVGTQHRPHSVRPCGPELLAVGVAEGRPRGGAPSTVVRGAWCQALSLPRPPVLWSGQPGFRDPCVPGAVDAGVWTQHRPYSVRPCGPALLAVGLAEGRPRGGVPSTVVRGAWCQALSLPRPPVLWSGQPGFRDPCVPGAVDAGVWTQHRPHSVRPCGPALLAVGVAEGRSRGGGAFHRCEGRLVSGAVPPPAARPLERAARVPRPVCPGCGRCGRVDPAPAPQRAPLRAGVARCGGGGRASPGGVPSTVVRGAWCQALSLPRPPVLWSGQPGFRDPCVPGAVDAGVWTQHRPHSVRPAGLRRWPALLAVGLAEGRPRGGVPSTVVRGAWCQALSLPRPPVLWSGQPRFRDPCVPGAVDAGVWTQHRPHSVRPCGPALLAVGVAEGRPRGGVPSTVVRGAWCQALSLPRPPVLWSGQPGFRDPCVPGAVDAGVWTQHRPHSVRPCGPALLAVGVAEASPGGVPSTVVRGAWCQALSLPRPPVLWSGQPGFRDPCVPGAVDAGVWTQHRPHSVRPCGPALLAVGVAEGRPRGGVPSTVVRGAWCQALSLPRPPVLWSGQPGFRHPCVPGAVDAGVWTQHRPHSVRPCGPALLAVGVAEGRPRGGCLPPL